MKTRWFLKLLLIPSLLGGFQKQLFSQDTAAAKNNLKLGVGLFNTKKYSAAIPYFENSINEVPTSYAYFLLGAAYCNTGSYENAKKNEYTALSASFNPVLTPKRNADALYIIKFSDSMLQVPRNYTGSGDALRSIPVVAINEPNNYDPFQTNKFIIVNPGLRPAHSVDVDSDKTPTNTNADNTNLQGIETNNTAEQSTYTVQQAINDYFNSRSGFEESLDGDGINNCGIKSLTNNSITLNVDYNYNPQHGNEIYLGAWFWNTVKENNDAGGYSPVLLSSPTGTAEITITLSDLKQSYTTQSIVVFISEPGKGPFSHRIFSYQHTWTP